MKFHFLGTSAGSPTIERNVTSLAITFDQRCHWYMFDCGDGTQQRILKSSLSLPRLDKIFITHMHGDHLYGLPGLLASRGLMSGSDSGVSIYGPKGIKKFIETVLRLSYTKIHYPINIHEFHEAGLLYKNTEESVDVVELSHDVPSYAFVLQENDRPGAFNVEKAKACDVTPGPLYGKLSRGEKIELADGRILNGLEFIGTPKKGRKVIICGDNDSPALLETHLANADLWIHESTHTELVRENLRWDSKHSTAKSVAQIAHKTNLKNLILTHFSPRFTLRPVESPSYSMKDIENEALAEYNSGNLFLARDSDIYNLSTEGELTLEFRWQQRNKFVTISSTAEEN